MKVERRCRIQNLMLHSSSMDSIWAAIDELYPSARLSKKSIGWWRKPCSSFSRLKGSDKQLFTMKSEQDYIPLFKWSAIFYWFHLKQSSFTKTSSPCANSCSKNSNVPFENLSCYSRFSKPRILNSQLHLRMKEILSSTVVNNSTVAAMKKSWNIWFSSVKLKKQKKIRVVL